MKTWFLKTCFFLHITDGSGQLDLVDLSFIATVVKIMVSPNVDWPSVCSLVPVIMAKMHVTHLRSKQRLTDTGK